MVVECSLSLPVRLYLEHFLHMNCGKIMDDFVWLDMISVPLGFGRLFLVPKWSILFHLDVQVCL